VNISQFIRTLKCPKCSNEVLYDDTPYHRIKNPEHLEFEIACPKCGMRLIYDKEFNRIN
jgi:DNA-directed RNA polymerase subunit RPC12/RpoP